MIVKGRFVGQIREQLKRDFLATYREPWRKPVRMGRPRLLFTKAKHFLQRFVRCMKGEGC